MGARRNSHTTAGHRGGPAARWKRAAVTVAALALPLAAAGIAAPPAWAAGGYTVTATISVGSEPGGVAVDPTTGTAYVANFGNNNVSVISEATNTVTATVPVGSEPGGVAVDQGAGTVYVANLGGTVSVISEATNKVTATVPVGSAPENVAADSSAGTVYVSNEGSGTVSVISAATNTVTATVPVGSEPGGVAVDPTTGTVYVTNFGNNNVSVISEATNNVTATVPVGAFLEGVAVDAALGVVYVSQGSGNVSVINAATNTVTATIPVGSGAGGLAVDPPAGTVYVANFGDNTVSVIDTATNTVKATVPVGTEPSEVAVNSATHIAYVSNYKTSTVSVIKGPLLTLGFPAPPSGQIGVAYSDTLSTNGGVTPYTWSVSAGALPPGITLGASSGVLGGTPTVAGTFAFTVMVTDADDQTATEAVSLAIAPSVVVSASASSVAFGTSVTLTATVVPAATTGSVVFDDKPSSGPQSGQVVTLGTAALSGGIAALTIDLPAFNTNSVTAVYSGDAKYPSGTSAPAAVRVTAYSGEVLINEFRLSGPASIPDLLDYDQYAELYNAGPAVSLAGFVLAPSSGASITVPASAPVLLTGGAYLIAGNEYSLSTVAAPDINASTFAHTNGSIGSVGLKVTAPDGLSTVTDAVGSVGAKTGYYSGTALPALSGTPTNQYAWVRVEARGVPANTGNNAADFKLVSTTGGLVGGVQSALGSPSPRASGSPGQANRVLQSTLLDPAKAATAAPNFAYVAGAPGLLTFRRTITNSSGSTITKALVRITSLSEVNGAPEPGVTTQPPAPAQLRVINPAAATSTFTIGGAAVTVQNLSVDSPASYNPATPGTGGGGLNTTLTIPLPSGLAKGASVSIALSFAVDRHGPYWFGYDVDASTAAGPLTARHQPARSGTTTTPSRRPAPPSLPATGPPARGYGDLP